VGKFFKQEKVVKKKERLVPILVQTHILEVAITILIGKMILTEQLVFITTKKNVLYVEKKKL
jgi:hypothetical protein